MTRVIVLPLTNWSYSTDQELVVSFDTTVAGDNVGANFGGFAHATLDATPREIEKAIVDVIVATAAESNIVVRPRDILIPALSQG